MNIYALLTLGVALVALLVGVFVPGAVKTARRAGKVRIFWWDPDGGVFEEEWVGRKGNEVRRKDKTFILEARARLPSLIPTWVLHPRHGWNYMPLSDAQTVERDALLQRLAISNPATYHNGLATNKPRQGFRANDPDNKWGWVVPVAIVFGVVIVLIFVGVMAVWYAMSHGAAVAGAAAAAAAPGGTVAT